MATVTISLSLDMSIPQNVKSVNDFCTVSGYTGFLADKITPQTHPQFIKAEFMRIFRERAASYAGRLASELAAQAEVVNANNVIIT